MITYQTCHQIANQKQENFWQQHCKQSTWPIFGGEILLQEDTMADFIWTDTVTPRHIDLIEENESIWNIRSKEYKNRDLRKGTVLEVCDALNITGESFEHKHIHTDIITLITLVNVYVDLVVFTRIVGNS